mgnify:CR=1 FL=1
MANLFAPFGFRPVNTSGGGLSYNHPGMYGLLVLIEAIRQVRGECDKRQVKNCDIALAHATGGGSLTARHGSATVILERE